MANSLMYLVASLGDVQVLAPHIYPITQDAITQDQF